MSSARSPDPESLKVAIIVDGLVAGGAERQAVLTAAALNERGQSAMVIACRPGNDYAALCAELDVRVVHVTARGPLRLGRVRALTDVLRREQVDVAHAFKGSPSTYGRLAARWAGVPRIFGGYRAILSPAWPFRLINRVLSWGTTGWIVNSEPVGRTVARDYGVGGERIFVVPNAVHPSTYESRLDRTGARARFEVPGDRIVVTMIANLRPEKNHPMLLDVARRLREEGAPALFLLAGAGPERARLERLIERLDLSSMVRLLGHRNDTPDLLRASDIVVLTTGAEGLPNALLEAGAAGLPCVSTDNGGAGEVIVEGETGFLVPVGDAQAMVACLRRLMDDPESRRAMGLRARTHVRERFSLAALGDKILAVYRRGRPRR